MQKLGRPYESEIVKAHSEVYDKEKGGYVTVDCGVLEKDTWHRQLTKEGEERGLSMMNGAPNVLVAFYKNGVVAQIATTLYGYETKTRLSVDSEYEAFEKHYGKPKWVVFNFDPDPPAGQSHHIEAWMEFPKYGLTVQSDGHHALGQVKVFAIYIEAPNTDHLFTTPYISGW